MIQAAKDSFFSALNDRLAILNPLRSVVIEGVVRPAVLVVENELATTAPTQPNTFYLTWNATGHAKGSLNVPQPLLEIGCHIAYWTEGSDALSYQDRGRSLGALDEELLAITTLDNAKLQDFTVTPPADLATAIFWTAPEFGKIIEDGRRLLREATIKVLYFFELNGL